MIHAVYDLNDGRYTYLHVSGHAESDEYGKDLICASVSSILFGFMNALDETGEKVRIDQSMNEIEIENDSRSEVVDHYFELVLIQLKTIEESYGEYIKVERKKNT